MAKAEQFEKPEGFTEHHRKKGTRGKDERPVNKILVSQELHMWIEEHPEESRRLGWSVSRSQSVDDIPIVIPDKIMTKERKPRAPRGARNRATIQLRVPQDQAEDGAGLWDEMIDIGREFLCEPMGWEDDVPAYNVAMVLMARGLEASRDELKGES